MCASDHFKQGFKKLQGSTHIGSLVVNRLLQLLTQFLEDRLQLVEMADLEGTAAADRPKETPEEKKARKEAEKKAKAAEKARKEAEKAARAAQRGQKAAILTAPDPSDPHGSHYGDAEVIQSKHRTNTVWNEVSDLSQTDAGKEVRICIMCVAQNIC